MCPHYQATGPRTRPTPSSTAPTTRAGVSRTSTSSGTPRGGSVWTTRGRWEGWGLGWTARGRSGGWTVWERGKWEGWKWTAFVWGRGLSEGSQVWRDWPDGWDPKEDQARGGGDRSTQDLSSRRGAGDQSHHVTGRNQGFTFFSEVSGRLFLLILLWLIIPFLPFPLFIFFLF